MHFLHLPLLYYVVSLFSVNPASEYPLSSQPKTYAAHATTTEEVAILQSKDGGQTWQDISHELPENQEPEDFFAGASAVYLRINNVLYRSKSNLKTPVWEKENVLDERNASIAFNRSGVVAYTYEGQVYQKMPATGNWMPIYTNFKKNTVLTIFEAVDGTIFLGSDNGLYKSGDTGKSWRKIQNAGGAMNIVESDGVLIGTSQNGIMRSTDNGEHWESVISEGGVGITVERINGGFAAISYNAATHSRRIRISMDNGKTWKAIDAGLPPSLSISSIKQIGNYLLCGHPAGIFRSSDMGKTWSSVHSGVDKKIEFKYVNAFTTPLADNKKVFKLYVSGNVVYAVARNAGC